MKTYLGIDPGAKTGYALWRDKQLYVSTTTFWAMARTLEQFAVPDHAHLEIIVVIENPALNRPVFPRLLTRNAMLKIAQNVGANKRDAALLIELAESLGFEVRQVKPTSAKWNRQTFERITKYTGRTSQHGRDAAKMVFGL